MIGKTTIGAIASLTASSVTAQYMPMEPPQAATNQVYNESAKSYDQHAASRIFGTGSNEMSPARKAKLAKAQADKAAAAAAAKPGQ